MRGRGECTEVRKGGWVGKKEGKRVQEEGRRRSREEGGIGQTKQPTLKPHSLQCNIQVHVAFSNSLSHRKTPHHGCSLRPC